MKNTEVEYWCEHCGKLVSFLDSFKCQMNILHETVKTIYASAVEKPVITLDNLHRHMGLHRKDKTSRIITRVAA